MDILFAWYRRIDDFEELQEFHAAVTALELPNHLASGHIQRCEQGGCPMAFVVVRARGRLAEGQW